ncbi:type IV pili methyl-accepting chemotaxis transducer N-terminal domain-containing protein [Acidovorax sp. LjRoot118]|uniref:type IV pili methyl-accepting chemotaxis transducer N-terminal domain-containing protein n=1 Tax=Acidovorax sp. LjRoot118 TaxID=3342256 RepID=UPI003F4FDA9A
MTHSTTTITAQHALQRRALLKAGAAAGAATMAGALGLGLALASRPAHAQVANLNDAINKAGRQRMLSQRMGKAWLALAHKVQEPAARQVLEQSVALFERQLAELKSYAPNPTIRNTYGQLDAAWVSHKATLLTGTPALAGATAMLQADAKVLALAHQGTVQYESASGKPVGHLVNVAGRQRMLSQRMAKFYLAAQLPVDAAVAAAEIAKARTEFVAATEVLRKAPEANDRIRQELLLADGQWVFFDAALQRMQAGGVAGSTARQVSEVFVASENLLSSMDRVTGLYAALAG